jgi:hypothetical protein
MRTDDCRGLEGAKCLHFEASGEFVACVGLLVRDTFLFLGLQFDYSDLIDVETVFCLSPIFGMDTH